VGTLIQTEKDVFDVHQKALLGVQVTCLRGLGTTKTRKGRNTCMCSKGGRNRIAVPTLGNKLRLYPTYQSIKILI
jgi:hypothetical protein